MGRRERRVVVSGGMKGIGRAIVDRFLATGDQVFVLDRESTGENWPEKVRAYPCDVTDEGQIQSIVQTIGCEVSGIDVLVNNVGDYLPQPFLHLTAEEWRVSLAQNLDSVFLVTRAILPLLRPGAVIINISSTLGEVPEPAAIPYSVAKAGVNMFTKCLALELAGAGVRVLAVAPGPIASGSNASTEICEITGQDLRGLNPLGRFGTPEEVASLVFFLCSKEASYMTGSIVHQNGGESALSAPWSALRAVGSGNITRAAQLELLRTLEPSERVRVSAEQVLSEARFVELRDDQLVAFVSRLSPDAVLDSYRWETDFHPTRTSSTDMIEFVFTIDCVNFGSGFSPEWKASREGSTYTAVASALTRLQQSGQRLDAAFAAEATPANVAALLGVPQEFPLVQMYAKAWNSLGRFVLDRYGSYEQLLASLPSEGRAQALVGLLVDHVPEFDDHGLYGGSAVFFYKRAQILVNDLHLALGEESPFSTADIASLTMFADNLVPHVFRKEGCLVYSSELLDRINARVPLAAGSPEETEIRAAGIVAVERCTHLLRSRGESRILPAILDVYLWNAGQNAHYKNEPRHLTKTFFY